MSTFNVVCLTESKQHLNNNNNNNNKCELICHSEFTPASPLLHSFIKVTPDVSLLLGAQIFPVGKLDSVLQHCCCKLYRAIDCLQSTDSHDARVCFSAPNI